MQNNIRAKAVGLTTCASWLANFMIGQVSPKAFANIGWKYYLVFTVCSFSNAVVFWLFFHETKGRTLEEMDHLLRTANIIVPLSKVEVLDAKARERQFAQGERRNLPSPSGADARLRGRQHGQAGAGVVYRGQGPGCGYRQEPRYGRRLHRRIVACLSGATCSRTKVEI